MLLQRIVYRLPNCARQAGPFPSRCCPNKALVQWPSIRHCSHLGRLWCIILQAWSDDIPARHYVRSACAGYDVGGVVLCCNVPLCTVSRMTCGN
jgi:hypothetical protein